jgi:hypothetical protein
MMDTIKCPVCGETNPANAEFCQNCRSRLEPLTGPLKEENAPLQPGQIPTKKVTAELEPILPQWLREAREKARQSASEDATEQSLFANNPTPAAPSTPDLLAGLTSQSDNEDEEVPDWLVSLTGDIPAKKKKNEPEADDNQVKWVELGDHDDFEEASPSINATQTPSETPVENTAPSWMMPQEPAPDKDELADWLSHTDQSSASVPDQSPASAQPIESTPSILPPSTSEDEDWLKNLESRPFGSAPAPEPQSSDQSKDLNTQSTSPAPLPTVNDVPDWLNNLQTQQPASQSLSPSIQEQQPGSNPDWLQASTPKQSASAAPAEVPDWLKAFGQTPATEEPPGSFSSSSDLPDWLKAAAPKSDSAAAPTPQSSADVSQKIEPATSLPSQDIEQTPVPPETPDWVSSLRPVEPQSSMVSVDSEASAFTPPAVPEPPASTPAFADDSTAGASTDAIFASMQIPDWLTALEPEHVDQSFSETNPPSPVQTGESIAPAELPSWVQAMRPVESAVPSSPTPSRASFAEGEGPLAGLQDVLPVGSGFGPTSKPKAYSIKLNATNEHQTQAALLDQILAAETAPIPMKAASVIMSQRVLRWAITALMFLFVGGILYAATQIFALPARVPNDQTEMAVSAMEKIPAGAPVLVVFDYEPSLSGEMQTVAEPYLSRLLLLKHPRLTILSSSPTGSALAEELMSSLQSGPLSIRGYQLGKQYVDLGYLPGGLAGVYDFAQNPTAVMPLDMDGLQAWQTAPLQGVVHFSDFSSIIILTDSAEAGRVWIEQAGPLRGNASLVIVSSSQAGPMLMPYVASGQVNGIVNGLNDASKIEQANGQAGLARRYWDAYSVGLLLAAAMIILGGFWSLVSGLQARRAERERS